MKSIFASILMILAPCFSWAKDSKITIDSRLWHSVAPEGSKDVELVKMICSSGFDPLRPNIFAQFRLRAIQQNVPPPTISGESPEVSQILVPWLSFAREYEQRVMQELQGHFHYANLERYVERAKNVIANYLTKQGEIDSKMKAEMVAAVRSVRLMNAEKLSALPPGPSKDAMTKSYMSVCGYDFSKVNAFYTPILDDKNQNILERVIFICPQYMLVKGEERQTDVDLVSTIGHEVGHAIDAYKNVAVDGDYAPAYSKMRKCVADNYSRHFKDLDKSMGEVSADLWGMLTMSDFLSEIEDPIAQITFLRNNLGIFCGPQMGHKPVVHPPDSFRVNQATQFPRVRAILEKANNWQIVQQPFCGI